MPRPKDTAATRYPSRRALREREAARQAAMEFHEYRAARNLREQQDLQELQAHERPGQKSPIPRKPETEQMPIPDAIPDINYLAMPVPKHEHPVASPLGAAAPARSSESRKRTPPRRRFGGLLAAASVGGLVLTLALPLTENAIQADAVPASQQRLFSEYDAPRDAIPDSLGNVAAAATESEAPVEFVYRPSAAVNYPFARSVLLTDGFGYRTAPVAQFHDAQDFAATEGTPIQAIADGTVLEAGFASDGCGFGLKLEHTIDGHEVTSRYCHMQDDSHSYEVGDELEMGDPVGKVGATGMAFGAHLHMAIVVDDKPIDPMVFIPKYHRIDRSELASEPSETTGAADAKPGDRSSTPVIELDELVTDLPEEHKQAEAG